MSKKRKSEDHDLTSAGPSHDVKAARFSQVNNSLRFGDVGGWEKRPGMIMEVKMRNFMCHQTFTFVPNQRLTFLSGENGSGKSAVLTAIVFALGSKASVAGRGNSNKAFIRTNQTSATVEVRLVNAGEGAYKPEVYGDSIRIARTVTNTSSTYKIMNDNGKPVVERKHKEELERILMAFNIQVDNPIAVLNQDTAKTFLFKCDPGHLYTFFMKATQLESCLKDYTTANDEKEHSKILLDEKKNSLPALKKEVDKWGKKYKFQLHLKDLKLDIQRKKGELAWAVVRDCEKEIDEFKEQEDVIRKKIVLVDEKKSKGNEREKEIVQEKRKIEKEIQDIAKMEGEISRREKELTDDFRKKQAVTKELRTTVLDLQRKIDSTTRDIKTIEAEIEKLRSAGTEDYERGHQKRMNQIRKYEEEADKLKAEVSTTENHLNHLNANSRDSENTIMELKAAKQRETGHSNKIQNELNNLRTRGQSKFAVFGRDIERVVNEIQRSNKFRSPPIGPLGVHTKVKQGTPENIVKAIDHEMRSVLTSFLVTCSEDQRELFSIFKRLGLQRKPTIFTCPFTNKQHNIENKRVYSDKFSVLIDFLEIDDINVYNRVVDACKLERVVYIPTTNEATCLSNPSQVPRNLQYATVANSYHYYPAPSYRSYFHHEQSTGLLKASVEEYIEELQQRLVGQQARERELEKRIREANDQKMNHMREVDASAQRLRELKNKIHGINGQIIRIQNEDSNEQPPDISALEDDVVKRRERLNTLKETLEERNSTFEEAATCSSQAKDAFNNFRNDASNKIDGVGHLQEQLAKVENEIRSFRRNQGYFDSKKEEYAESIKKIEESIKKTQEKLDDYVQKAGYFSTERIETRKKADSLRKEIVSAEEGVKQQEMTMESRQVVTENFRKFKDNFDRANSQIKYLGETFDFLVGMLEVRKKGFKEIRNKTCKMVNTNFTTQLSARNYIGRLDFSHRESTLKIVVNTDPKESAAALDVESERDIRSLSGGEKSYSSVSLILSLWESMTPPFRILDEFDVFMDSVNRKIAIQNILNFARIGRKFQFVFLTPLGTANIETGEDVKIIKLSKIQN